MTYKQQKFISQFWRLKVQDKNGQILVRTFFIVCRLLTASSYHGKRVREHFGVPLNGNYPIQEGSALML